MLQNRHRIHLCTFCYRVNIINNHFLIKITLFPYSVGYIDTKSYILCASIVLSAEDITAGSLGRGDFVPSNSFAPISKSRRDEASKISVIAMYLINNNDERKRSQLHLY